MSILNHKALFSVVDDALLYAAPNHTIDASQGRPHLGNQFLFCQAGKLSPAVIAPDAPQYPFANGQKGNAGHGIRGQVHSAGEHFAEEQVKVKHLPHPLEHGLLVQNQNTAGCFDPHRIGLVFRGEYLYLAKHISCGKGVYHNSVAAAGFLLHLKQAGQHNIKAAGRHGSRGDDAVPFRILPLLEFLPDLRRSCLRQLQNVNGHNTLLRTKQSQNVYFQYSILFRG